MQEITVTVQGPHSENSCRRELRHAYGERGGCIEIQVWRERGKCDVTWSVNKGRGWLPRRKKSGMTEEAALSFAAAKWEVLAKWLRELEPVQRGGGAAAAFSAQVATMQR